MARKTKDSVVVITGASSGIGRATALAFAEKGASVVLAARRDGALREVAAECRAAGGRALVAPTDVTDEEATGSLARRAVENFGRIDVWVNNAAVALFGRFEEVPSDAYRRVFETNVFGYIHGARAAFPYFREQGQGVLINVSSVVAKTSQPYTSAYVASKFAIRGLCECLRQELILDGGGDIHVCNVMPASIDTPFFQHAANYTGRAPKALDPVYGAGRVARAIVRCARRPKREVVVGSAGRMLAVQHALSLGLYERAAARVVDRDHFENRAAPPTEGNLFEPMPGWTGVSGGWKRGGGGSAAARKALLAGAGAAVPIVLGWRWLRNGRDSKEELLTRAAKWRLG